MSEHCHLESCRDRGSQPGKACRVEVDAIGAGVGSADEGLDVNVHAFGLSPISLNLTPTRSRGALPNLEERGEERGRPPKGRRWTEIGVPDCFISCYTDHSVIHMSLVFIASGSV